MYERIVMLYEILARAASWAASWLVICLFMTIPAGAFAMYNHDDLLTFAGYTLFLASGFIFFTSFDEGVGYTHDEGPRWHLFVLWAIALLFLAFDSWLPAVVTLPLLFGVWAIGGAFVGIRNMQDAKADYEWRMAYQQANEYRPIERTKEEILAIAFANMEAEDEARRAEILARPAERTWRDDVADERAALLARYRAARA
jgi:hypothetical protein